MKPKYFDDSGQSICIDRSKFESCYLLSHQKSTRLRHLSQISAVNLNLLHADLPDGKAALPAHKSLSKMFEGFVFTLSINKDHVIYTSEFQTGRNPIWNTFDMKRTVPSTIHSLQGVIVSIWLNKRGQNSIITSWGVNFSGLIPIGQFMSDLPNHMAPNTIILRLMGWLYTSPECLTSSLSNPNKMPLFKSFTLPISRTKYGCTVSALMGLKTKEQERQAIEKKIGFLVRDYEENNKDVDPYVQNILGEIDVSRMLVSRLKKQVDIEIAGLAVKKQKLEDLDSSNQMKISDTLSNIRIMNRELNQMKQSQELENEEVKKFNDTILELSRRRGQLLADLSLVFPIQQNQDKKFKICDVHLPLAEHYHGCSDQSLSVAIGYVAYLLVKVSVLVNMPMPFPIHLFGSHCTITDRITISSHDKNQRFQLFARGKDRETTFFYYGVFLLNKNIAQMRWNCGLPSRDLRPTLQNLMELIHWLSTKRITSPYCCFPDLAADCPLYPSVMIMQLQETDGANILNTKTSENYHIRSSYETISPKSIVPKQFEDSLCSFRISVNDRCLENIGISLDEGLNRINSGESPLLIGQSSSVSELNLQQDELPGPFVSTRTSLYHDSPRKMSPPFINDEHRKTVDQTFTDVIQKYFLKRSSSADRITGLMARVPYLASKKDHEVKADDQIEACSDTIKPIPSSETDERTKILVPEDDDNSDESFVAVCSRTKVLASQNCSFKLLFKDFPEKS